MKETQIIRRANIKDIEQIINLANKEPYFKAEKEDETLCFWPKETLEQMTRTPDTSVFLVSETINNNQITGFVISQYWETGKKATFENAYLKPEHRRTGLYKQLGDAMIQELKKMGCQFICAFPETENSISTKSLSKNFGFAKGKTYHWMMKEL